MCGGVFLGCVIGVVVLVVVEFDDDGGDEGDLVTGGTEGGSGEAC